MEKKFEYLEHTADLKYRAYGKSLNEVFENAAVGLFTKVLGEEGFDELGVELKHEVSLTASSLETLLHDWLSELIYLYSAEDLFFKKFDVDIKEYSLSAKLSGEKLDISKTPIETEVKACTYHDMLVEETKDGKWTIQVVCDI